MSSEREYARLRAIEEAARWHLANSACRGWPSGEVLALALGLDPDAPQQEFNRLLGMLGIEAEDDPLLGMLADEADEAGSADHE